jgi:hypothetical protein
MCSLSTTLHRWRGFDRLTPSGPAASGKADPLQNRCFSLNYDDRGTGDHPGTGPTRRSTHGLPGSHPMGRGPSKRGKKAGESNAGAPGGRAGPGLVPAHFPLGFLVLSPLSDCERRTQGATCPEPHRVQVPRGLSLMGGGVHRLGRARARVATGEGARLGCCCPVYSGYRVSSCPVSLSFRAREGVKPG